MESLAELLKQCESLHGHMCAGQVLGARMGMLGCSLIGIDDPKGSDRKNLIVWVEIDRCMTDAVSAVTGVRLGKRSLKFVDYGKVAATFLNLETKQAVRVVALENSRELAEVRYPELPDKRSRQMRTYLEASEDDLFNVQKVNVQLSEMDEPGKPRSRVICANCGEGVNDGREVGELCRACVGGGYYEATPG
jgi:formylmethanofuran dehydrogenase subunit E